VFLAGKFFAGERFAILRFYAFRVFGDFCFSIFRIFLSPNFWHGARRSTLDGRLRRRPLLVAVITNDFWAITWCCVGVVVRWSSAFAAVKGTTIVAQGFSAREIALIQDF
jgi:hypothetical protein